MPNIYTQVTRWNLKSTQGCLKTKSVLGRMFDEFCKLQKVFGFIFFYPSKISDAQKIKKTGEQSFFFLSQYNFFFLKKTIPVLDSKISNPFPKDGWDNKKIQSLLSKHVSLNFTGESSTVKKHFFFWRKTQSYQKTYPSIFPEETKSAKNVSPDFTWESRHCQKKYRLVSLKKDGKNLLVKRY